MNDDVRIDENWFKEPVKPRRNPMKYLNVILSAVLLAGIVITLATIWR